MLTQMVLAGLITVLLFMVGRPVRRLWQMVEMSVSMVGAAVPSPGGGIFSRFRRNSTGPTPQDEFWQNVRDTDDVVDGEQRGPLGATAGGGRFRPEATIFANAQRLDNASGASARPPLGPAPGRGPSTAVPRARCPRAAAPAPRCSASTTRPTATAASTSSSARAAVRRRGRRAGASTPRRWPTAAGPTSPSPSSCRPTCAPRVRLQRLPGAGRAAGAGRACPAAPRRPRSRRRKAGFRAVPAVAGIEVREEPRDTDHVMGR